MLFDVYRLFNGEVTTCHGHTVRTLDGFVRCIRKYATGNGHGFKVAIPLAYANRLGLTEGCGVLFGPEGPICLGEVQKP
jgi:hypothetical protein